MLDHEIPAAAETAVVHADRRGPLRADLRALIALATYTTVAFAYLRPIWKTFSNQVPGEPGDPLFTTYILKWVVHQARIGFPNLWDAPFFFPQHGALALSDHMIGPALSIVFLANPVTGYNLLFFSSFVLCGLSTWWVLERSGCSFVAALAGGAIFAFSPLRFTNTNHLLLLIAQWIPLVLWSFHRLLIERTVKTALVFLGFYGLHVLGGCYLAYMIHFPLLAILVSRWVEEGRRLFSPSSLRVLVPTGVAAATLTAMIFLPYVTRAHELHLTHDDESEVVRNSAALTSYVSPSPQNWYFLHPRDLVAFGRRFALAQPFLRNEGSLFAGFLPTLFLVVGFRGLWRRQRARPSTPPVARRRIVLTALLAVAVALYLLGDTLTLGLTQTTWLTDRVPWAPAPTLTRLGVCFLATVALWIWLHGRWREGPSRWKEVAPWERAVAYSGIVCFLLSHSLVYLALMRVVPGMSSMRAPTRFGLLFSFVVAFFAAHGLDRFREAVKGSWWRTAASGGVLVLLLLELAPRPLRWVEVLREGDFPAVYAWVAAHSEVRALAEVPMRQNWREVGPMYYSSRHWRPIANGYSSFVPQLHRNLASHLVALPDLGGLALLDQVGVTHIIVHTDQAARRMGNPSGRDAMMRRWEREFTGRVALVFDAEPDRVYRLLPIRLASLGRNQACRQPEEQRRPAVPQVRSAERLGELDERPPVPDRLTRWGAGAGRAALPPTDWRAPASRRRAR